MKKVFDPAMFVMSNLTYFRKFLLLGGLSLTALLIVSITLISNLSGSIDRANQQLSGFNQAEKISRLIQFLQKRRGLSAAVISGINGSKNKQRIINSSVINSFNEIANELPEDIKKTPDYSNLFEQWGHLTTNNETIGLKESFDLHTELINSVNALQLKLADHNFLLVIDDPDSYYLTNSFLFTVPIMLETLAQSRAVGVTYLIGQSNESKSTLKALLSNVFIPLNVFKSNMAKVQRGFDTNIKRVTSHTLMSVIEKHVNSTVINVIDKKFISGKKMDHNSSLTPIEFYNLSTSVIDEGYQFLNTSLYLTLSNLLQNRATQVNNQLILSIGLSSILFVIVLYFIIGLYLSTIRSINSLTQTTTKFYDGDRLG